MKVSGGMLPTLLSLDTNLNAKMNVQFLEPAKNEFTEAVNYYNAQTDALGADFSKEVKATIA